jgi:hypothetical protein
MRYRMRDVNTKYGGIAPGRRNPQVSPGARYSAFRAFGDEQRIGSIAQKPRSIECRYDDGGVNGQYPLFQTARSSRPIATCTGCRQALRRKYSARVLPILLIRSTTSRENDMRIKQAYSAALFAGTLLTHSVVHADVVNWGDAYALAGDGGFIHPSMLVGFNPQPEPPIYLSSLNLDDPTTARITINADPGAQFTLYFGMYSGIEPTPFVFDAGGDPDASGDFSFQAFSDAGDLLVEMNIMSSSGGVPTPGTWVGFNPQPEPPVAFGAGQGLGFMFDMTSLSDVVLEFRVMKYDDGEYIAFTEVANPVPVPAAIVLLPAGLAMLGALARSCPQERLRNRRHT